MVINHNYFVASTLVLLISIEILNFPAAKLKFTYNFVEFITILLRFQKIFPRIMKVANHEPDDY